MCFSPQRRAIFQHLNCKKWSENAVFCTFSLENVLLATAACNFSTSELQKVLRDRQFFSIFTSKCASRHSGVQFLISPLTTWLRTRRFNEPTFRLTRHTNHWKNTAFRDASNIWRGCIFFLLTFALLHLLSSDFTSSHLLFICFSTKPIDLSWCSTTAAKSPRLSQLDPSLPGQRFSAGAKGELFKWFQVKKAGSYYTGLCLVTRKWATDDNFPY